MAKKSFKFDGLIKAAEQQKAAAEKQQKDTVAYIKSNITIKEELKSLIPPLAPDEYAKLEQSILSEGCRDALIIWKDENKQYILVDGHNRHQICTKHDLDFKVQLMDFDGIEQVSDWMVDNQLGKRNVTEETKSYLRGIQYNREKRKIGENQYTTQNRLGQSVPSLSTAERLAQQHKVSEKTIKRDENYAMAIDKIAVDDKGLKWDILNRRLPLTKTAVTELAKEEDEVIAEVIELVLQGMSFKQAIKQVKDIQVADPYKEKVKNIKSNIVNSINDAIRKKDASLLKEVIEHLKELEKTISK